MNRMLMGPFKGQMLKSRSKKNKSFINLRRGSVSSNAADSTPIPEILLVDHDACSNIQTIPEVSQDQEETVDDCQHHPVQETLNQETLHCPDTHCKMTTRTEKERTRGLPAQALIGRRIVDLRYLATQMKCFTCRHLLHLEDFFGEERNYGLASEIPLKCPKCSLVNFIYTSKDNNTKGLERDRRSRIFDTNAKLALAMIDSGLGATHLNKVLTTLNIPSVGFSLMKRHEEIVGDALQMQSEKCMIKATIKEKHLTWVNAERSLSTGIVTLEDFDDFSKFSENWFAKVATENANSEGGRGDSEPEIDQNEVPSDTETPSQDCDKNLEKAIIPDYILAYVQDRGIRELPGPIGASMDAAWMTRGNGKFTNSKTGHAELIGVYSGEVLASGRRHRHCTLCKTKSPEDHECHTNWTGSSKAMEADIIANLVVNLQGSARVTVLVGDEDSSTMAKIRELVPWNVSKVTDVVHAKKNFGNALFAARHKLLTPKIIEYLKDCMSYALHQNQDQPEQVKAAILNIPAHVFNDHTNCGQWCRFKRDPENYRHKRLPEIWAGSEDNKQSLKNVLATICEKFAAKAKSLAPCLSSNVNESFNFVVTTFAPKNRHYAGTQSIDRRIDGAVLQKNTGFQYVVEINKELNLSPGDHTKKHRLAVELHMKRKSAKSKLPEEKVKRRKTFKMSVQEQLQKEKTEGVQYKSAMGFSNATEEIQSNNNPVQQHEDHTLNAETAPNNTQQKSTQNIGTEPILCQHAKKTKTRRPTMTGTPVSKRISANVDFVFVVFDTETTGLSDTDEIVQLAAQSDVANFNQYCSPSVKFSAAAAKVNKFSCRAGKLYQDGKLVTTVTKSEMLQNFLHFMEEHGKPVVLVAHNANFDIRMLWKELKLQQLTQKLLDIFLGYCDSINYFKSKMQGLPSYKLCDISKTVMGNDYVFKEHDASGDVAALSQMLELTGFGKEEGIQFSVSSQSFVDNSEQLQKVKKMAQSLAEHSAKLTDATIKSLVNSDLSYQVLLELTVSKEEFKNVVTKCLKVRAAERCEEIYKIFTSIQKTQ